MERSTQTIAAPERPLVIADRGASSEAPEHTIAAIELALEQGADAVWIGVHLTRDDQPVVFNDFTLERTTDGAGPIAARTLRELKRLDAGAWRGTRFSGQRLQALHEVLERFRERTSFCVALRGGSDVYPALEERVVSVVEMYDVVARVSVHSLDPRALGRLRQRCSDLPLGRLAGRCDVPELLSDPGPIGCLTAPAARLDLRVVGEALRSGVACYAQLADEPGNLAWLVGCGVRGFVTSRPGDIVARLGPSR